MQHDAGTACTLRTSACALPELVTERGSEETRGERASQPRGATLLFLRVLSEQGAGLLAALERARAKAVLGLWGVCALSGWEHLHVRGQPRMRACCGFYVRKTWT